MKRLSAKGLLIFALLCMVFLSVCTGAVAVFNGTATPLETPESSEYGKLIWKQDFDGASSVGDYLYDPVYSSVYCAEGASLGDSSYIYVGDGDDTNPVFAVAENPVTGTGNSLSMLGKSTYPIYKINFGGDILSKPGKYTFVFGGYRGSTSVSGACRFLVNRCYQNAPEMGAVSFGTDSFIKNNFSFTVCTREEFNESGISESSFTSTRVFAFQYIYLFLYSGNDKTVYFDDLEMWFEEYADVTFHTEGPSSAVTAAADTFLPQKHKSFAPGSELPSYVVPGSGYSFVGWTRVKNDRSTLETSASAGKYDLYALYEKNSEASETKNDELSVYEAVMKISKLNSSLFGRSSELPEASEFSDCLAYAEKYKLLPDVVFDHYDRSLLRSEFAQMLCRSVPEETLLQINNVTGIPDVYGYLSFSGDVLTLCRAGIMGTKGDNGEFKPYDGLLKSDFEDSISRIEGTVQRLTFSLVPDEKNDTMIYDSEQRDNFEASFISAPQGYLSDLETMPDSVLVMGKWITTTVTRSHIRRDFTVGKEIAKAEVEIQSDNPFDFYINGSVISETQDKNGWHLTGLCDVSQYIVSGTNRIAIRGYTSDEPLRTISALRACIKITYADGTTEEILSDSSWKNGTVCGFWTGTEPSGWQTSDIPSNYYSVSAYDIHPRLLRRSCLFRKEFVSAKSVEKAYLYCTSKGLYVPYINGERVSDARFIPGSMQKLTEYQVFDVTQLVFGGTNIIAAETGNGYLNCASWGSVYANVPSVMMQLEIEYSDGSKETVCTDSTWKVSASPLTDNDYQFGERYDARLEKDGWNSKATPEGEWVSAKEISYPSLSPFAPQTYPAVKIRREVRALSVNPIMDGKYMCYDFGQNSAGRAKIVLKNTKPGEMIIIRYCELLDGETPVVGVYSDVYFENDNRENGKSPYGARNIDVYICKGAEEEVYLPEFAYTGFRYVYISGYSGEYTLGTVLKAELNTDLEETGDFTTSNAGLSKIWDAVKRSYRSNIVTGPTDCPTREKNFWNGDIQMFATTACWYMNNDAFLSRWTDAGRKLEYDVYGWEDEEYILPLTLYRFYGNTEVLEKKYSVITTLIEKRLSQIPSGSVLPTDHSPYNDHQATSNVPSDFYAAAYYCRMYKETAQIAEILGKTEDAQKYSAKFEELKAAFNQKYYLAGSNDYSPENQSGIILPVAFGLAKKENLEDLAKSLHNYVVSADYHLTCGFSSAEYVLGILCDNGYSDDALKIITNTTYPSLLNMLSTHTGGTTTETWAGYSLSSGNSMNHYTIGSVSRWFFEYLGGIKMKTAALEQVQIKPYFYKELGDCNVSYNSKFGKVISEWEYNDSSENYTWTVTVPEGMTADCSVPEGMSFFEGSDQLEDKSFEKTAGQYSFTVGKEIKKALEPGRIPAQFSEKYGQLVFFENFTENTGFVNLADISRVPYIYDEPSSSIDGFYALRAGQTALNPKPVGIEVQRNGDAWTYSDGTPIKGEMTMYVELYSDDNAPANRFTVAAPGTDWGDYFTTWTVDSGSALSRQWASIYSKPIDVSDFTRFGILSDNWQGEYYRVLAVYVKPSNALWLADTDGNNKTFVSEATDFYTFPSQFNLQAVRAWTDGQDTYAAGTPVKLSLVAGKIFVPTENLIPSSLNVASIRTSDPNGIRFAAFVSNEQKAAVDEYGFIIARKTALGDNTENLVFNSSGDASSKNQSGITYVSGQSYNKQNNIDKVFSFDGTGFGENSLGEGCYFTALLYNIAPENYKEVLVCRPYTKVGTTYYYGQCAEKSIYEIAAVIRDGGYVGLDEKARIVIDNIIALAN